MWSFHNLLLILYTALSCVTSAAGVIHVFGYEGRDVQVSCSYESGYEDYEKYLCKNDCGNSDVLIRTSERNKTKYSIYDDKKTRIFTTSISDLRSIDAGKYWCGVDKTGKDVYTEVKLELSRDSCCEDVIKLQGYEESSVSISCPYESQYTDNLKYICRGNQPSTCLQQAVITSDNTQKRRFGLTDDNVSRFTVNISSLTLEDSGLYLCGVHRNTGLDDFSAVHLEVREWCCVKSEAMSGIVGHPVTLQCPYPPQHQKNRKFLCKGDQRNNCRDMTSQSRFTLHNASSNSFSVTIAELEAGDAGTYWCGSDSQWSFGNYTKIHLSQDMTLFYVLPAVLVLLLILAFVLLMVFKKNLRKLQGGVTMKPMNAADSGREMTVNDIRKQGCKSKTFQAAYTVIDIYCVSHSFQTYGI